MHSKQTNTPQNRQDCKLSSASGDFGVAPQNRDNEQNSKHDEAAKNTQTASKRTAQLNGLIRAADGLSLGISIVVAIFIGIALGWLLAKLYAPLFWLGVAFGIAAAINNVYIAYKRLLDE